MWFLFNYFFYLKNNYHSKNWDVIKSIKCTPFMGLNHVSLKTKKFRIKLFYFTLRFQFWLEANTTFVSSESFLTWKESVAYLMIDARLWKINWFDEISACLHLYLESTQPLIQEETHEMYKLCIKLIDIHLFSLLTNLYLLDWKLYSTYKVTDHIKLIHIQRYCAYRLPNQITI